MMNSAGIQRRKPLALVLIVLFLMVLHSSVVFAQRYSPTNQRERIDIVLDESHLINLPLNAERVSIVNSEIATVQILEPRQILVSAVGLGKTSMIIWFNSRTVTYDIVVTLNTQQIEEAIQTVLPGEKITVTPMKESVALMGDVKDSLVVEKAMEVAMAYSENVMNFLNVPGLSQILLQVKVAEVSRDFEQEYGMDFLINDDSIVAGGLLNDLYSGENLASLDTVEIGQLATSFFAFPKSDVSVFVQALERRGLIHILAEPNLIARSGETANFLAGGEIPIPVVQGISNRVSIEWKEFGVRLNFTPTLLNDNKIHLDIAPEVSELDFANGITLSGFTVPALVTRRAHTVVVLEEEQTFAIAGLMRRNQNDAERRIPVIGKIPLFGNLFRGRDVEANETELMIMVTPKLVAPLDNAEQYIEPMSNQAKMDMIDLNEIPPERREAAMRQLTNPHEYDPSQEPEIYNPDEYDSLDAANVPPGRTVNGARTDPYNPGSPKNEGVKLRSRNFYTK